MNNDMFKEKWNQMKGKIKAKWSKLTDNDLNQIDGKRHMLLNKLQSYYGWAEHQATEELKKFESSLSLDHNKAAPAPYNATKADNASHKNKDAHNKMKGDNAPNKDRKDKKDDYPKRKVG